MSKDDHLDNETSISAKLDESGFGAKAKSRFISSVDRLLGNITEFASISLEDRNSARRQRMEADQQVMQAAVDAISKDIREDSALARQVLNSAFSQMARRHLNKSLIVEAAAGELAANSSIKHEQDTDPAELSEDFLDRFERYSEDASAEDARAKWAKVLAAEVKKPGTFSLKVMRAIDEIDHQTAAWFAEAARFRVGNSIPSILFQPDYPVQTALIEAELINASFGGVIRLGHLQTLTTGEESYVFGFGEVMYRVSPDDLQARLNGFKEKDIITWVTKSKVPGIPILPLTNTGVSLLSILEDPTKVNSRLLLSKLRRFDPMARLMEPVEGTNQFFDTAD